MDKMKTRREGYTPGPHDPAVAQLLAALDRAAMELVTDWHIDWSQIPRSISPLRFATGGNPSPPAHPALHALLEMRSDPSLAWDCALTIVEFLFPSRDPEVGGEIPERWWQTPLGQEVEAVVGTEPRPRGEMSVADAAAVLGVDRRTILRWRRAGRFPGAREERVPGGMRWLIPTREVETVARERA
jgi:excisionase family DNA binding protein